MRQFIVPIEFQKWGCGETVKEGETLKIYSKFTSMATKKVNDKNVASCSGITSKDFRIKGNNGPQNEFA